MTSLIPGTDLPAHFSPGPMPPALIEAFKRNRPREEPGDDGAPIPEGRRNATLTSLAGTMRRPGMTEAEILPALLAANENRCDPPLSDEEVRVIARSVARYAPAGQPAPERTPFRLLSTVRERAIEWLWPGRLAWGNVAVLAGDGGVGKSTLAQMIAAGMTRGEAPPGGSLSGPRNVLVLTTEEDAQAVYRPRMRLMGADLDRVFDLNPEVALKLPSGTDVLAAFCAQHDIGMVTVDTGPSFMDPGSNSHKEEAIRAFLEPLHRIAQQQRAVPLVLAHLNKAAGADSRHRVMGGAAWVNAPRLVLIVAAPPGEDPRTTGARMLAVEKSNLGVYPKALAFSLTAHPDDETRATVEWGDEVDGVNAADLVRPPDDPEQRTKRDEARAWLTEVLGDGPRSAQEIRQAAAGLFSKRTLDRAKSDLGVVPLRQSTGNGGAGGWLWSLPEGAGKDATT